jgi:HPr kinase/phosphorylase
VVEIRRVSGTLVGSGPELTRYHMEVRGLGIINVKDLFGVAAVRQKKFVELLVRLDPWKEGVAYERLGLDERTEEIMGVGVPLVTMPVAPGRNLSVLIEVAARHHLLKLRGYNAAQELERRILQTLGPSRNPIPAPSPTENEPEKDPER